MNVRHTVGFIIHVASCLTEHNSMQHIFGIWLGGISKELNSLVLLGAAALLALFMALANQEW